MIILDNFKIGKKENSSLTRPHKEILDDDLIIKIKSFGE